MKVEQAIYQGTVIRNPYGNWDDVDKGYYIDDDNIECIFSKYQDRNVKVTIEILED